MQNNILDPYNSKSAQNSHARAIPKREIELGRAPALNDIKKRLNAPETHGRKRHGSAASNQYLKIRHGPAVVSAYMDDCQQNRGTQQVIAQMERDKAAGVFPRGSIIKSVQARIDVGNIRVANAIDGSLSKVGAVPNRTVSMQESHIGTVAINKRGNYTTSFPGR